MSLFPSRQAASVPRPAEVPSLEPLARALDEASPDERLTWMRSLRPKEQFTLFELAQGTQLSAWDLVGDGEEVVIWEGKNTMPVNRFFQKRIARLGDEVVGYNHNRQLTLKLVGPGHFVVYDAPDAPGEVIIDYRRTPQQRHPEFPPLVSNDRGIGPRVTYGTGMVDVLRRVSQHVVIGLAKRKLPPRRSAFALCRQTR